MIDIEELLDDLERAAAEKATNWEWGNSAAQDQKAVDNAKQKIIDYIANREMLIKQAWDDRLAKAEKVLEQYADPSNWTDIYCYEEEDYRSIDANGCPDAFDCEVQLDGPLAWRDDCGYALAEGYFNQEYPEDK